MGRHRNPSEGSSGLPVMGSRWAAEKGDGTVARYVIRARSYGGKVEFNEPLTLEDALKKVAELRDAHFQRITLINTVTGVEITELEELMQGDGNQA